MKTFFSKLNKFGVFAVLFAALITTGLSAFTKSSGREDHLYGKQSNGVWVNIDNLDPDPEAPYIPGTYRCDASLNSCTVVASSQPLNGSNPAGATLGTFTIN